MRGRTAEPGMADQADLPSHQPFGPKRQRLAPLLCGDLLFTASISWISFPHGELFPSWWWW